MSQLMNQFIQAPVLGQLDLMLNGNTLSAYIDPAYAGAPLAPGQAVKRVAAVGGIPVVTPTTADSDDVFGIIEYDIKHFQFIAGYKCNVSWFRGNVIYLTSSAAIAAYAKFKMVHGTPGSIAAPTTGDVISGRTVDSASASGQLIRCVLDLPGVVSP
jgi:hypothetical protein